MSTNCRAYGCDNKPGEQDRDDYNTRKYCSVQCQTKHEHIKEDAKQAQMDAEREAQIDKRHPGNVGKFL